MRVAWLLGIVAGCYSPTPAPGSPCTSTGECPKGLECRNDICELPISDGDGGGGGEVPIDVMVDACPGARCSGNTLVACGETFDCEHGCGESPAPHCNVLKPSNQVTTDLLQTATADLSGDRVDIDTSTGRIYIPGPGGGNELRAAGTGLINGIRFEVIDGAGVFAANSFAIAPSHRWDIDGSNPLVLLAATTITIAGTLDATASKASPGPGGTGSNTSTSLGGCRGHAGRLLATQHGEGGGGGGGETAGGEGGASDASGPTGIAGTQCNSRSSTRPLRGGSGGGAGAVSSSNAGGGGGGAVALVALESITVTGVVSASGGGGSSGTVGVTVGSGEAGGGGGSGGAILLEAPSVTVTGALTANGGAGGAPSGTDGGNGILGSATPAVGGSFTGPGGTASGGNGGAGMTPPTNGQTYNYNDGLAQPTSVTSRGGGGGGAVGRIEIRTTTRSTNGAVISPPAATTLPDYE